MQKDDNFDPRRMMMAAWCVRRCLGHFLVLGRWGSSRVSSLRPQGLRVCGLKA